MTRKVYFIGLFIIILFLILSMLFPIRIQITAANGLNRFAIGELKENDELKLHFTTNLKNIDKIKLLFATFNKKNENGKIKLILKNSKNKIIAKKIMDLSQIKDNSYHSIKFKKQKNSDREKYILSVKYIEYYRGNSISIWANNITDKENYLELNNKTLNDVKLYCSLRGYSKTYDLILYEVLLIFIWTLMFSIRGDDNE